MIENTKKFNYMAPAVKVVAFQVEQGFAGSGDNQPTSSNNAFIPTGNNVVTRTESADYYWAEAPTQGSDKWF